MVTGLGEWNKVITLLFIVFYPVSSSLSFSVPSSFPFLTPSKPFFFDVLWYFHWCFLRKQSIVATGLGWILDNGQEWERKQQNQEGHQIFYLVCLFSLVHSFLFFWLFFFRYYNQEKKPLKNAFLLFLNTPELDPNWMVGGMIG